MSVDVNTDPRLGTYEEFWPFYLKEHSKSNTRHLHYLGSGLALTALCAAGVKKDARLLAAVPFAGYGPAWVAHFFVEKNTPATFKYPLWSFCSDFRMFYLWLSGKLDTELEKYDESAKAKEA